MTAEEIDTLAATERFKLLLDEFADSAVELTQAIDRMIANPEANALRKRFVRLRPKIGVLARATMLVMPEIKPPVPGRMN